MFEAFFPEIVRVLLIMKRVNILQLNICASIYDDEVTTWVL
jgi:hypothetical protein